MKQAQLPDGTILEFPDETPDAVMDMTVKKHLGVDNGFAETAANTLGRGVRAAAMGVSFPGRLIADTIAMGVNAATGQNRPLPTQGFQKMLSGLPKAQTPGGRMTDAAIEGMTNPLSWVAGPMGMASGASGAGATQYAADKGYGPVGQTLFGLAGGLVPSGARLAADPVMGALRGIKSASQPFYQGGREAIAGRGLRSLAANPNAAINNLDNVPEFVPGSKPTTGQASKDYGLLAAERGLRNSRPQAFAETESRNNTARNIFFQGMSKERADIEQAVQLRDRVTSPLREAAFQNASGVVDAAPVFKAIDDVLKSPTGKGPEVRTGLTAAKQYLQSIGDDLSDPATAYEARKGLASAVEKSLESADPSKAGQAKKLAGGLLSSITKVLDEQIDAAAPGYKDYLSTYRTMSKPINEMETLQDVGSRVMNTIPDPITGMDTFSQAKWSNVLRNNQSELKKVLTPQQLKNLDKITADLDRGAATNSPLIKASGSDTLQNITTANILGSILNRGPAAKNPAMDTLMRPLQWIYKIPNEAIQEIVVDAMNDPEMARKLMLNANPLTVRSLSSALKERALQAGTGAAIGAAQEKK